MNDFIESCDGDADCMLSGSKWSVLFIVNGLLMLFLMFNMVCVGFGTKMPACRVTGAIVGGILGLVNFAMIVTTAVYRFSAIGMLCSMDVTSTN